MANPIIIFFTGRSMIITRITDPRERGLQLGAYLALEDNFAKGVPNNIGGALGKVYDYATGTAYNKVGYGQKIGGGINDLATFVYSNPSGFVRPGRFSGWLGRGADYWMWLKGYLSNF